VAFTSCEAHIDADKIVVGHLQLLRFDWFIGLLCDTLR